MIQSSTMPKREDVTLQLFIALLYFVGTYIVADVFLPDYAFIAAVVGQGLAMIGYLILRALELDKPGPILGVYISLGVALLTFGLIWQVARGILRSLGRWPLDQR